jgi:cation diffusion facilitator family transporter
LLGHHDAGHSQGAAASVSEAGREKRWVALTSVGAAIVLTGTKLAVGLATGSLGLLAEAAHSGLDLVAAVVTYFAVRISDKPADADHLYGHGKIENLSALVETLLLLATCVWIISEGIERLFFKEVRVEANTWSFVVIVGSIVIDVSRSRALMRIARKHGSQALEADALHFSTDVWSSVVVLLGLILVKIGDLNTGLRSLERADAVAALLVALIVVYVSVRLGRRTIDALLDRAPAGQYAVVERAAREVPGVLECRQIRLRPSGNQTFVDLVIGVERGRSLESSHAIGQAVEQRIKEVLPHADIVVHIDPMCGAGETLAERIRVIAVNEGQTVHNILVAEEEGRTYIELHVEADENMELGAAHARADRLEAALRAELPHVAEITTHIEPRHRQDEPLRDVTGRSTGLLKRVRQIVAETPGIVECHDVALRRAGKELFLSMHCTFAPGLSIREVHEISTRLEEQLRAALPNLVRVTTHPEPLPPGRPPRVAQE